MSQTLRALSGAAAIAAAGLAAPGCTLVSGPTDCEGDGCVDTGEVECELADRAPDELYDTCFARIAAGEVAPNLRSFEPQYPMYTGEVDKQRWIYLPPGSAINASNVDDWELPTGTILWQEFAAGDRIETQMLEKTGAGIGRGAWRASVYLWTADQSNAHRERRPTDGYVIDALADWSEPDESACMDCHQAPADVALGFTALQLSDLERDGNIDSWRDYLASTPDPPGPVEIAGTELDRRMLGSMHANCGTCHSPRGIVAGLGLDLSYSVAQTSDLASSNAMLTSLYNDLRLVPGNVGGSGLYALVADGSMPPERRTSAIDTAFRDELRQWILDLEWPTVTLVDLPATVDAGTPEGRALFGYGTVVPDAVQGEAFSRQAPYHFRSRVAVPIDPSLTYRVSGRFRSNGVTPSRIYYGLAPFDASGQFISAYRANRQGALTAIDRAATTAQSIATTGVVDDWYQPTTQGFRRAIGIYYDGDTTRLPDFVLINPTSGASTGPEFGAYSAAAGTAIALNVELPPEVLAQMTDQTTVANHYSGGTYLYAAASSAMVGPDWADFSGDVTGTAFSGGSLTFRPGTAYAKLIILANYQQNGEATELLWDDLRLEVVTP